MVERGTTIGNYQVLFRLGSGGMGEVWRARDTRDNREVAIKVLSREASRDPERMKRFATEAKATSALKHRNILEVFEVGEHPDSPYLVTEYVDGATVRNLLNDGPLPLERAVDIALQAAEGVATAHAVGMVHRDLKPENLMVDRHGVVKILDFGLAKLLRPGGVTDMSSARTATGMIIGTAGYLSPEQLRGGQATERSDVFALGLVLYEMATGDNPFRRNNPVETFAAILREDPPPLDPKLGPVPVELTLAIGKALAKAPAERYATAAELAQGLRVVQSRMAPPPEPKAVEPDGSGAGTRWAALGAVLVAIGAASFFLLRGC